ncbi:hypothetical protein PV377_43720 [Streptomyces ipomoeae]|uniref:hypothetical protein n=1 Tax=Streptomyces ipomoeae TaxID=103232 RepID=UPI0029AA5B04|nr:hypothetical protein [Streptomyces ipomoeae]MDX2845747.1 hypothetical protein [Streptomyces ipomoeae]
MTTPSDDSTSPMLATAETMLASRLEVIKPLASAIAERKRLQGLIDDADKAYGAAYAAASAAGWSPDELRRMGAEEPTRRPQGRPKGSRTRRTRSGAEGGTDSASVSSPSTAS